MSMRTTRRAVSMPAKLAMLVALAAGSAPATAQSRAEAPPVALDELYRLAWSGSPRLEAERGLARATAAREPSAGLPPDPVLRLGAMNLSLPDLSADMASSMAPSIELMQMVPFPGKLGAMRGIARQTTTMAEAQAAERWWEVRTEVAAAFHELYSADARLDVMRETLALLDDMHAVAQSMYATGTGRQSDVLRATVERARMDADIQRMEAMRVASAARLNAALGRAADTPIGRPQPPVAPMPLPSLDTLRAWAEASRPMLGRSRAAVTRAGAQVDLARRELWPDLSIGAGYGQRAGDMGTERMGSLMIGFSLPVFAGARQLRMRDEASAMESMAEAELALDRALVDAGITELLAELERARSLIALYLQEILPQAEGNVVSAMSSYRSGAVDFMTLVDARMSANDYEQELHALRADYGQGIAELEMTIGRELTRSDVMTAEAP